MSCDIAVTVKAAAREAARQTFILMTVDGQLPLRFSKCSALRKSGCKKRARRWREAIAMHIAWQPDFTMHQLQNKE